MKRALTTSFLLSLVLAVLFSVLPAAADAQPAPDWVRQSWVPYANASTTATTSSGSTAVALPTGPTVNICNQGSNDVYLTLGGPTVTTTTNGYWLKAGTCTAYGTSSIKATYTYAAFVTGSSTSNVYMEGGLGTPPTVTASSGGGSGGNASVGSNNATAPGSSTQIGSQDGSGNLQAASATNPIPTTNSTATGANAGTAAGNNLLTGTRYLSSPPTLTNAQQQSLLSDQYGNVLMNCNANCNQTDESSFTAGTSAFGNVGGMYQTTATSNPLTNGQNGTAQLTAYRAMHTNPRNSSGVEIFTSTTPGYVSPQATTAGGGIPYTLNSAASTNATNVKSSAGNIYHISVQNNGAAEAYLLLFNSASTPTCTGTPVWTEQIPAVSSTGNAVGGIAEDFSAGLTFTTGIGFCITTAIGGTGSVAANQLTLNFSYK